MILLFLFPKKQKNIPIKKNAIEKGILYSESTSHKADNYNIGHPKLELPSTIYLFLFCTTDYI